MIRNQTPPSWESIFRMVGEPVPRRRRARCPIHGGDSPTSLSLNEDKGVYFCHVCHASGDKLDFVRKVRGTDFKGALPVLGIEASRKPTQPDPEIIRQREAVEQVREWCRQTGRRLRDHYLTRQRIARYAAEKLAADPESTLGWELLRIASDGEAKIEYLLDEIDLCRTDAERIHAWRRHHDEF